MTEVKYTIEEKAPPLWRSKRFRLALLTFMGFVCTNSMRINLRIAIVCMVSDNDSNSDIEDSDCPFWSDHVEDGEFDWSKSLQDIILGAFFWGYLTLQIPGGRLSESHGAKRVVAYAMFPVAILNILTPGAARTCPYLLIPLRMLVGAGESVMYPSAHALWANWAPRHERTMLIGFSYAGGQFGNALMFPIGGYLCSHAGWDSVFYFFGSVGFFWCLLWSVYVYDIPSEHPSITKLEKHYINTSLGRLVDFAKPPEQSPVPWKDIFTSRPFWAILIAQVCGNYGSYLLVTKIPTYMKDVLKFDVKHNEFCSMVPYLSFCVVIVAGGIIADRIILSEIISAKNTRKMMACLGLVLPGIFIIVLGYLDCDQAHGAVFLLCVFAGFCGLQFCSVFVNHSDIAPMHAGTIFGITNTVATIPGILTPSIVSAMTTNGSREEWQKTFYLAAIIYFLGAFFYCFLAEATLQPWAKTERFSNIMKNDKVRKTVSFDLDGLDDEKNDDDEDTKNDEDDDGHDESDDDDEDKKMKDMLKSLNLIEIGEELPL